MPEVHVCWPAGVDVPMTERDPKVVRLHEFFEKSGRRPPDLPPPSNGLYEDESGVPTPAPPVMPRRIRKYLFRLTKYANKLIAGLRPRFDDFPFDEVVLFPEAYVSVHDREGAFPILVSLPLLPEVEVPGVRTPMPGGTNQSTQVSGGLVVPGPGHREELSTQTWSKLVVGIVSEVMENGHGLAAVERVRQELRTGKEGISFYESEDFEWAPETLDPEVLSSEEVASHLYEVPLLANTFDLAPAVPSIHGPSTGGYAEDYTKNNLASYRANWFLTIPRSIDRQGSGGSPPLRVVRHVC